MQVGSVSYANLVESRSNSSPVPTSGETELKSQGSTLSAPTEPDKNNSSGQQSEQKPSEENVEIKFSDEELKLIKKLEARDLEVRAHEQAHQAVGGQYAGAASFTYQRGPDGVNYAIGGEVQIDASEIPGNPEATIQKADQVKRAALAPAEPSVQDRSVAALANQIKLQAQSELAELNAQEREEQQAEREERLEQAQGTSEEQDSTASADEESTAQFITSTASSQESEEDSEPSTNQSDEESSQSDDSDSGVEFSNVGLSPTDFANLLAADIARRNALAVFENINREPPKGNLDELV